MNDENFCRRDWGTWEVIDKGPWYKVKRLVIDPGKSISLQYHLKRSETWAITDGLGEVRLDGDNFKVKQGDTFVVPVGAVHKITNISKLPLVIIEVQCGEITEEDDIVRLGIKP
jgi:mannose-6-phosphate isomerase-like protein (cupin superfamily)